VFGLMASIILKYVKFVRRILLVLMGVEKTRIKLLKDNKKRVFRVVIWSKFPTLQHCWGSMDGVKLQIEKPSVDI